MADLEERLDQLEAEIKKPSLRRSGNWMSVSGLLI